MFTLRRIALAPRACGTAVVQRPAMESVVAVSKPIMNCIQQQRPRRYSSSSSSKPSNPSDGARSPSSSTATNATNSIAQTPTMKRSGRAGLKAIKTPSGMMKEGTNIPVVPSTDHLHPADVAISTFFAQHRPVSISHVVPLSYSETSFDSIFTRRKLHPIHDSRFSSAASDFEALESAAESGGLDPVIRTAGSSGGSASHHQINASSPIQLPAHLLQLSRKYMPFHPPPPPTPHTAFVRPIPTPVPRVRARAPKVPQKMVQIVQVPVKDGTPMFTPNTMDMPYLEREMVRERGLEESDTRQEIEEPEGDKGVMQALSVKRLRKLKMKKHKLKKLRKRTRNLRRRIESHSR